MLVQRYRVLLISVMLFVASAICLLLISISSDYWKYVKVIKTNKTSHVMQQISHSGLFHTCYTLSLIEKKSGCEPISLPNVENTSDNNAINSYYITVLSLVFPVASALTLIVATCACVYGFWSHKRRSTLLFASLFYVTAGLLNVVGLMCYINRTNDELGGGNSKKEENIVQEYEYAWSFYMATVSFGFTEVSAVLCIYFYNELLRLAKHLTQHRTKAAAAAADSASIQHSNGPHASLSGGAGAKLIETHHGGDGGTVPGGYDEALEGAQFYSQPSPGGYSQCVNQFSSMPAAAFINHSMSNHINASNPAAAVPPPPPLYQQPPPQANSTTLHNLHNQAVMQHQPPSSSAVSSRPSSVVAIIPMSTGSGAPQQVLKAAPGQPPLDPAATESLFAACNEQLSFAPVFSAAGDIISLAPIHPQPIRIQQQNSVSSTASSPPQPQHMAAPSASMAMGYCNGNPPGGASTGVGGTLAMITSTPPQVITPLNRTSSKPYMVNDTVV